MALAQPKSGVVELTATVGTIPYVMSGVPPGSPWRPFASADNGKLVSYGCYLDGFGFEEGEGTYTHATRTLTRDVITGNHLSTSSPVDWPVADKELAWVQSSSRIVMSNAENQFGADQSMNGWKLLLDADRDTYIKASSDDIVEIFANGLQHFILSGGTTSLLVQSHDQTAVYGPFLHLVRKNGFGAAADGAGGVIFDANNDAGTQASMAYIRAGIKSATAGNHSADLDFFVANLGTLQHIQRLTQNCLTMQSGKSIYTNSKISPNDAVVGAELSSNGTVHAVAAGVTPMVCGRNSSDGAMIDFARDGGFVGSISVTAGNLNYGPFTGSHWVEWHPSFADCLEYEKEGTVLETADGMLVAKPEPVKYVLPASRGSRRAFGVYAERQECPFGGAEHPLLISLFGVGNGYIRTIGPVSDGDMLWSAGEGLAERQPDQEVWGPWTVAKSIDDAPDDGAEHLIACTFHQG